MGGRRTGRRWQAVQEAAELLGDALSQDVDERGLELLTGQRTQLPLVDHVPRLPHVLPRATEVQRFQQQHSLAVREAAAHVADDAGDGDELTRGESRQRTETDRRESGDQARHCQGRPDGRPDGAARAARFGFCGELCVCLNPAAVRCASGKLGL